MTGWFMEQHPWIETWMTCELHESSEGSVTLGSQGTPNDGWAVADTMNLVSLIIGVWIIWRCHVYHSKHEMKNKHLDDGCFAMIGLSEVDLILKSWIFWAYLCPFHVLFVLMKKLAKKVLAMMIDCNTEWIWLQQQEQQQQEQHDCRSSPSSNNNTATDNKQYPWRPSVLTSDSHFLFLSSWKLVRVSLPGWFTPNNKFLLRG